MTYLPQTDETIRSNIELKSALDRAGEKDADERMQQYWAEKFIRTAIRLQEEAR